MGVCYAGAEKREDGKYYCKIHKDEETVLTRSKGLGWSPNCDTCEDMFITHLDPDDDCLPNCLSCMNLY